MKVHKLVGALALPLAIGGVQAEQLKMESILVTAHAPVSQQDNFLANLAVLDASDIELQQPQDIHQLLDGIKGVYVSREGGAGGVNSISIRGAEANFTAVLIDGVAVNDPTNTRGGSFDLATMSAAQLQRVELVTGPRSVVFGSDALAGVVKLITAPGDGEASGIKLFHEVQEYGAFRSAGRATLAGGGHALSVQGTREDSGAVWQGSERQLEEAALHYRLKLDSALLQIGGREARFDKRAYPEQSGGPRHAQSDARDRSTGSDQTAYVSGEWSPLEHWRLATQYTEYHRELDYHSPGIVPYDSVPENFYVADYRRQQWRVVSETNWAGVNINVGIDRRWENGVSDGAVVFPGVPVDDAGFLVGLPSAPADTGLVVPLAITLDTDYALRRTTEGQFAEVNWQSRHSVLLSAGLRKDDVDGEQEVVRRYLLGLPLSAWGRVNLSYSEGFKAPSFFALGHGLVGNPELKPERVSSYQVDVSAQLSDFDIELALFDADYRDLIDFDSESFTNVNRDRVRSRGAELSLATNLQSWTLRGSVSHVEINVENSDRNLANRPQNTATFDLSKQWDESLSWHSRLRWIDKQYASSMHSGESREYQLDDYLLWDTVLRWQALSSLELSAGIKNIADVSYEEAVGFPGAGRSLRLSVAYSL